MERASASGPLPRRKPTAHAHSVATLLLAALDAAGEEGLLVSEAVVLSGARDEAHLRQVVSLLGNVSLPLEPPHDAVPVEITPDTVRLYMRTLAAVLPTLTEGELGALRSAGLEPWPQPLERVAA